MVRAAYALPTSLTGHLAPMRAICGHFRSIIMVFCTLARKPFFCGVIAKDGVFMRLSDGSTFVSPHYLLSDILVCPD